MARTGLAKDFHIGPAAPGFVNNVRRMLQVKQAKYYTHGHKHGRLSQSRVWRAGMPVMDDGDWNSRIFKKRESHGDVTNTAITVLVDWSGSMGGTKSMYAAKAAGLLNDAFCRVLHIPVEILSFSSWGEDPTIGVIKDFGHNATADQIADRFVAFLDYMGGNNDADSLQFAYQRLILRKEKRKILIVMSDGQPTDGHGDPVYALKRVVQDIVAKRQVELYGVGILDSSVKRFYPKWRVITDAEGIQGSLVELLGDALK